MTYKLNVRSFVVKVNDNTQLPVEWVNGAAVEFDVHSPLVKEFREWVVLGNTPLPTTP